MTQFFDIFIEEHNKNKYKIKRLFIISIFVYKISILSVFLGERNILSTKSISSKL